MLKYKNNHTLSQGGLDIGLKVGILAQIGYMLHECTQSTKFVLEKNTIIVLQIFIHVNPNQSYTRKFSVLLEHY